VSYDLVVKNGTIVTHTETYQADIGIKGEKIAAIGTDLLAAAGNGKKPQVIDAKGLYVMPGGIDVHVHLQLPFCGTVSADDFETGTRAAARGGVTTVVDFAGQDPEKGLWAGIESRMKEAEKKVCVDYSLHGMITKWNDNIRKELKKCMDKGVTSFKMFTIYEKEGWNSDDAAFFSALTESAQTGATICAHAESEKVMNYLIDLYHKQTKQLGAYGHALSRPNFIEEEAIQRLAKWAEVTGGKLYIVHMSTGEGANQIRAAQERGARVFAETCPQYLVLNDEVFKDKKNGHLYGTCPQIKKKADNARLWKGLMDGEVSVVSTDTCTFNKKQKSMWNGDFTKIPWGMPGVETLLPALYTHGVLGKKFDINHYVRLISTNPARMFGMFPRKGTIAIGSDADLNIFHPTKAKKIDYKELATNCDWSPFQGESLAGFPVFTVSRGEIVVDKGKWIGKVGRGKFIPRGIGEDVYIPANPRRELAAARK